MYINLVHEGKVYYFKVDTVRLSASIMVHYTFGTKTLRAILNAAATGIAVHSTDGLCEGDFISAHKAVKLGIMEKVK